MQTMVPVAELSSETMGHVTIINAPKTFATIWKAIKGWLAPQTQAKIEILGSDYQSRLLEDVDPENLPAELGGTCQCPEGWSVLYGKVDDKRAKEFQQHAEFQRAVERRTPAQSSANESTPTERSSSWRWSGGNNQFATRGHGGTTLSHPVCRCSGARDAYARGRTR